MAKPASTTTTRAPRKPARTLAEQIADLQAKQDAIAKKESDRLKEALSEVEERIIKAEPKLIALLGRRRELRSLLGWTEDEKGDLVPPVTDEATPTDESVAAE